MRVTAEQKRGLIWDASAHRWRGPAQPESQITRRELLALPVLAAAPVLDPVAWNPTAHAYTPVSGGLYDAADAGVTFDGVTDDTAKWQALIALVPSGQIITCPPGVSLVSAVLDFGAKSLTLRGSGKGITIIRQKADANQTGGLLTWAAGAANVTLEGLTIDANKGSNSNASGCSALAGTATVNWTIRDCEFMGSYGGTTTPCVSLGGANVGLKFVSNDVHDAGTVGSTPSDGIYVSGADGQIIGNRIWNCTDTGIVVESVGTSGVPSARNVVGENIVNGTPQGISVDTAISGTYGAGAVVTGNHVEGASATNGAAIRVFQSSPGVSLLETVVANNVVRDSTDGDGITIQNVTDVSVGGNICSSISPTKSGKMGLRILDCVRVALGPNDIRGCGSHGVQISGCTGVAGTLGVSQGNGQSFASAAGLVMGNDTGQQTYVSITGGLTTGNPYGIIWTGDNADYMTLVGIDCRSNTNGQSVGSNTGTHNQIRACPGYNPVGPATVAVGGSPWTYTAGNSPETLHLIDGTVSGVTKGGITLAAASPASFQLEPHDAVIVTYSVAPTAAKDVH